MDCPACGPNANCSFTRLIEENGPSLIHVMTNDDRAALVRARAEIYNAHALLKHYGVPDSNSLCERIKKLHDAHCTDWTCET